MNSRAKSTWANRGEYFAALERVASYRENRESMRLSIRWIKIHVLAEVRRIRHTDTFHEEVIPGEPPPFVPRLPEGWDKIRRSQWGLF